MVLKLSAECASQSLQRRCQGVVSLLFRFPLLLAAFSTHSHLQMGRKKIIIKRIAEDRPRQVRTPMIIHYCADYVFKAQVWINEEGV
jgi:hypothetical protein